MRRKDLRQASVQDYAHIGAHDGGGPEPFPELDVVKVYRVIVVRKEYGACLEGDAPSEYPPDVLHDERVYRGGDHLWLVRAAATRHVVVRHEDEVHHRRGRCHV